MVASRKETLDAQQGERFRRRAEEHFGCLRVQPTRRIRLSQPKLRIAEDTGQVLRRASDLASEGWSPYSSGSDDRPLSIPFPGRVEDGRGGRRPRG
jgi:hypothetical protein